MVDHEQAWAVASARARPVLRLVPPLPPEPQPPPGERVLVAAEGFRLTSERLEAQGHSYRLEEIREVATRHATPHLKLPLALGLLAALVEPALLLQPRSLLVSVGLVVATSLVFASILWLVLAADTYWVAVRTAEGEQQVLRCRDHQLFARVVEALGEALGQGRPAPSPEQWARAR